MHVNGWPRAGRRRGAFRFDVDQMPARGAA
jgi:hypothetical protein